MIYHTVAPSPGRILGLVRLLEPSGKRGIPRPEICDLMDPPALRTRPVAEPRDIAEILGAAVEAGLAEEFSARGQKSLRLASTLPDGSSMPDGPSEKLPELMARLLLRAEVQGKANHFAEACAWLLTQPLIGCPQGHLALRTGLEAAGFDLDEIQLKNEARLDMFLYWASYLGLIWRARQSGGHGVIPDPTHFLRARMGRLLPPGEEVSVATFLTRLGEECPVLDGGVVRSAVLRRMEESGVLPATTEGLSDSLSFALRRLRMEGLLTWSYVNDSFTFRDLSRGERINFLQSRTGRPES
jgi:hypothetical protein